MEEKRQGGEASPLPPILLDVVDLEGELDAEPHAERRVVRDLTLRRAEARRVSRLGEVRVELTRGALQVLVGAADLLAVEQVEEVGADRQLRPAGQLERIVHVDVDPGVFFATAQDPAAAEGDLARVEVDRVGVELADGHARLQVDQTPDVERVASLEGVAAGEVDDVQAVRVERADRELVSEHAELTCREVEERADGGGGLAVVVAEVSLEVALDLGGPPVAQEPPAVGEALVQLDLEGPVPVLHVREALGDSLRPGAAGGVARGCGWRQAGALCG